MALDLGLIHQDKFISFKMKTNQLFFTVLITLHLVIFMKV